MTDASLASLAGLTRVAGQLAAVPAAGANLLRRVRAERPAGFLEWAADGDAPPRRAHAHRGRTQHHPVRLPQLDRRHRRPDRGAPHQPRPRRRPGAPDGVRHGASGEPASSSTTTATSRAHGRPSPRRCSAPAATSPGGPTRKTERPRRSTALRHNARIGRRRPEWRGENLSKASVLSSSQLDSVAAPKKWLRPRRAKRSRS